MQRARDGSGCRAPIDGSSDPTAFLPDSSHACMHLRGHTDPEYVTSTSHAYACTHLRGLGTDLLRLRGHMHACMHACMHTGRAPPCMRSMHVCTRALAILVDRAAIILYVLRATVHRTSFHPSDPWPLLADVIETKRRADRRNPSFPRPCLAGSLARSPPPPLTSHRRPAPRMPACMHATALFAVRTTAGMPFGRLPCSKPASARSSGRQKSY
jgi:hypothetical protein